MKKYQINLLSFISVKEVNTDRTIRSFRSTNTVIVGQEEINLAIDNLSCSLDVVKKSIESLEADKIS